MNFKPLSNKKQSNTRGKKSKLREWADALLFAVVVSTFVRGMVFSAFAIPSGSMEGSLLTGDYLFVSKLPYGPRMPVNIPKQGQTITLTDSILTLYGPAIANYEHAKVTQREKNILQATGNQANTHLS